MSSHTITNDAIYTTRRARLHLHRLVMVMAGAQCPEIASELTADDILEAATHLEDRYFISTWNPARSKGALDSNPSQPIFDRILSRRRSNAPPQTPEAPQRPSPPKARQGPAPVTSPFPSPTAQGLQPHVIVLIDGDGYLFNKEILTEGRQGGIKAARAIAETVSEELGHRLDYRLSVYLFLNEAGLFGKLVSSDPDSYTFPGLREFMFGFQAPAFNYVINIGHGKENVDTKLKELFRVSLRAPDTESIILGVLHDAGYATSIESEILFQHKIKLLSGFRDREIWPTQFSHLPTLTIPDLFVHPTITSITPDPDAARAAKRTRTVKKKAEPSGGAAKYSTSSPAGASDSNSNPTNPKPTLDVSRDAKVEEKTAVDARSLWSTQEISSTFDNESVPPPRKKGHDSKGATWSELQGDVRSEDWLSPPRGQHWPRFEKDAPPHGKPWLKELGERRARAGKGAEP